MLALERAREMLSEAWAFYDEAIKSLEQGDLRLAAGKAWNATESATNALILECTGREPQDYRETSVEIAHLGQQGSEQSAFRSRFASQLEDLFGDCYVDNHCDPEDYHEDMIRNTDSFIREAERLADTKG